MLNALLIIFVIAKILGFITWSWWIVLSPLLIQVLIVLLSLISCIIAKFKIDKLWDFETNEEKDVVNPGVKDQKVKMMLPVKCEENWIIRRKK